MHVQDTPDVSRVRMFRRPRFTMSEAILLNALVNASKPMTVADLLRTLERVYPRPFRRERSTITRYVCTMRAKLGEESRRPRLVKSVYIEVDGEPRLAYIYDDAVLDTIQATIGELVPAGSLYA